MQNKLAILDFINSHNDWEEILSKNPYNLIIKHKYPFVLLKYNQLSSDMKLQEVQEARGLILKNVGDTYRVASMRFNKFFNYGQEEAAKLDFTHPVEMSQKIDGSLIGFWYDDITGWHMSTSGNIDARDSELQFKKDGLNNYEDLFLVASKLPIKIDKFDKNFTYIFELVSPYNRVIVPYKETEPYLLSIRNNETLEELNTKLVDEIANMLGFKRPKTFLCRNINDAIDAVNRLKENDEHFEGFVLRDYKNNRLKMKSNDYMDLFFIKGEGVFSYKKILKLILDEKDDDIIAHFDEYKDDFNLVRKALSIWLQQIKSELNVAIAKSELDKKEFAEWAKTTKCPSMMFNVYKLKRWDEKWLKIQINNIPIDRLLMYIGMKEGKKE